MTHLPAPIMLEEAMARLTQARAAIERASTFPEVKDVHDVLEALRLYARQQRLSLEIMGRIAELTAQAARKAGDLLKKMPKNPGSRSRFANTPGENSTFSPVPTLAELGIHKATAARWQLLAELSAEDIEEESAHAQERGEVVTQEALVKLAKRRRRPETVEPPPLPEGEFDLIYCDPPFRYEFSAVEGWAPEVHYPTMELPQIAALEVDGLPVAAKFAANAVLALWVPAPKLSEGLALMKEWGFRYRTGFVWEKNGPGAGMGWLLRVDHEHLLLGVRGQVPAPPPDRRFPSIIKEPKGKHSEKPQRAREILEAMYPDARRLELFARGQFPGWTCWGAEGGE